MGLALDKGRWDAILSDPTAHPLVPVPEFFAVGPLLPSIPDVLVKGGVCLIDSSPFFYYSSLCLAYAV